MKPANTSTLVLLILVAGLTSYLFAEDLHSFTEITGMDVHIESGCVDADGDGVNGSGTDCGPVDCRDNDPVIQPPRSNLTMLTNITFCPGTYSNISMFVKSSNLLLKCNNTVINRTGAMSHYYAYAINVTNYNNITIKNCRFANYGPALWIINSTNSTFLNNTFIKGISTAAEGSIELINVTNTKVFNNTFINGTTYNWMVSLWDSKNNTISNNAARNILGIVLFGYSNNNVISNNDIRIISGVENYGIWLYSVLHKIENISIYNNRISNPSNGILVTSGKNIQIFNNTIINSTGGTSQNSAIGLLNWGNACQSNNTKINIYNNKIYNISSTTGIGLFIQSEATNISVFNNTMHNADKTRGTAVYIGTTGTSSCKIPKNISVFSNNISSVRVGVQLGDAKQISIYRNVISNILGSVNHGGITLAYGSYSEIYSNSLNNVGVCGICMWENSSSNKIYSNTVLNFSYSDTASSIFAPILFVAATTTSANNSFTSNLLAGGNRSIYLYDFASENNFTNNKIVNYTKVGIRLGHIIGSTAIGKANLNRFVNNTIIGSRDSRTTAINVTKSIGNMFLYNNITNNYFGITLFDVNRTNISMNKFYNVTYAINFPSAMKSKNNTLLNNTFNHVKTTALFSQGKGVINYESLINATNTNDLYLGSVIAAVNSTIDRGLNQSANITLYAGRCPASLIYFINFTKNIDFLRTQGKTCNDASSAPCTDIVCANKLVSFNVKQFASYGVNCTDFDRDGFNSTDECGIMDCNDEDASVQPLKNNGTINRSITICPSVYNLLDGIRINASNVKITCNSSTLINGTLKNRGIFILNKTNVSITNCNITKYGVGILLENSTNSSIYRNIFMSNMSGRDLTGVKISNSRNNRIYNNILRTNDIGIDLRSKNNTVYLNNLSSSYAGISMSRNASNNSLFKNVMSSNRVSIALFAGATDNRVYTNTIASNTKLGINISLALRNVLSNNTFTSNTLADIYSKKGSNNTLIILHGADRLAYLNKFINVSDIDRYTIGKSIAAVNSLLEQSMNSSAEITLAGLSYASVPTIVRLETYSTNVATVNLTGANCPASICQNTVYSAGVLKFNVTRFSSYSAKTTVVTTSPATAVETETVSRPSVNYFAPCEGNFTCGEWSSCVSGKQTRTCSDLMRCYKPRNETRVCEIIPEVKPQPETPAPEKPTVTKEIAPKTNILAILIGLLILAITVSIFVVVERWVSPVKRRQDSYDVIATRNMMKNARAALPRNRKMAKHLYGDALRAYQALALQKRKLLEDEIEALKNEVNPASVAETEDTIAVREMIQKATRYSSRSKTLAVHIYNEAANAYDLLPQEQKALVKDDLNELKNLLR